MSAVKRKRETIPDSYIKGEGIKGQLHPHWRKHFEEDEEDEVGRGKIEHGPPGYGVWRRVPGFWLILASETGHIATKGETKVRKPTIDYNYYETVNCNNKFEKVHLLVCRAFHGAALAHHTSANHVGFAELSEETRRQMNSARNLAWATHKEQMKDRRHHETNSRGEGCVVWQILGDGENAMQQVGKRLHFESCNCASKVLGLSQPALSCVFLGKQQKTRAYNGLWFTGEYNKSDQEDLSGELWESFSISIRISNHGRIQTKHSKGEQWGPKRWPKKKDPKGYCTVRCDDKNHRVHSIVGKLFYKGEYPPSWDRWDHKDGNRRNNHVDNLRPSNAVANAKNSKRSKPFYIWSLKCVDKRFRFENQCDAVEVLGITRSGLSRVLSKKGKHTGGYAAVYTNEVDALT